MPSFITYPLKKRNENNVFFKKTAELLGCKKHFNVNMKENYTGDVYKDGLIFFKEKK